MNYNGQNETITIKQLLAQTSGIPSDITSEDSVTNKNNRLNDVTRAIMGDELHHKPGKEFEYSNMNYDLLGLIIQNVTKQSYTKIYYKFMAQAFAYDTYIIQTNQ